MDSFLLFDTFNLELSIVYNEQSRVIIYKYRGSYMSAHVLLILFNKLRKRDKMQGLPSILSLSQQA